MNRLILSMVALIASALTAAAADLAPRSTYTKAPAYDPSYNWSGFYVGANAGYGWGDPTANYTGNDTPATLLVTGATGLTGAQAVGTTSIHTRGAIGGFEAGYNWQLGPTWLLGLEADIDASGIRGQGSTTTLVQGPPATPGNQMVTAQENIDWYGTVRGRVGWLVNNNFLLFGTGGLAYGHTSESSTYTSSGPFGIGISGVSFGCTANIACFSGNNSGVKAGWTAGGGAEWRFAPNWGLKAEYLYMNIGGVTVRSVAQAPLSGSQPSIINANLGAVAFQTVRAGIDYHF